MDEKRALARKRVLKAGTIEFGGSAIDCTVRNLSTTGAALDVPSPVGIPDKFDLVVSSDALRFACRAVWRKAARISGGRSRTGPLGQSRRPPCSRSWLQP
jgi:hypothetical protein